ncbi:hypothetical protein ACLOJK_024964 [Asimina triloba]
MGSIFLEMGTCKKKKKAVAVYDSGKKLRRTAGRPCGREGTCDLRLGDERDPQGLPRERERERGVVGEANIGQRRVGEDGWVWVSSEWEGRHGESGTDRLGSDDGIFASVAL